MAEQARDRLAEIQTRYGRGGDFKNHAVDFLLALVESQAHKRPMTMVPLETTDEGEERFSRQRDAFNATHRDLALDPKWKCPLCDRPGDQHDARCFVKGLTDEAHRLREERDEVRLELVRAERRQTVYLDLNAGMREALLAIRDYEEPWPQDPSDVYEYFQEIARDALAGEGGPAREQATTRGCPNCQGHGRVRDSMTIHPVTCIRCDGRGVIPDPAPAGEGGPAAEESTL